MSAKPKTKSPNIDFVRSEVVNLMARWKLIEDCICGQEVIKAASTEYLPKPNASEKSDENSARYAAYLKRAIFYNICSRTLKGLLGQVFARDPVVSLPLQINAMQADVDGGGVSLDQLSRKMLAYVLTKGRAGILTDYPKGTKVATIADQAAGTIRPTITLYQPEQIINWRLKTEGSEKFLTLIVIRENRVVDDDGFEQKSDTFWRVLYIDAATGNYNFQLFSQDKNSEFSVEDAGMPLDASGKPWKRIPFQFIGAENNDPAPDLPPFYDLAVLNIGHYCNSADYEESVFMVGQPTPVLTGLTEEWANKVLKGKVKLGSRAAILLPVGGKAELLQADPNVMPKDAMEMKEKQMVAIGAKLIEQAVVQRTATEIGIEEAANTSLLAICAQNVSSAVTQALKWAAKFAGGDDVKVSFELNTNFDITRMDANQQQSLILLWQAGAISKDEVRDNLRRGGIAFQNEADFEAALKKFPPPLPAAPPKAPLPSGG